MPSLLWTLQAFLQPTCISHVAPPGLSKPCPSFLFARSLTTLNTLQRSAFIPCDLLSFQFNQTNDLEKSDHNHLTVGNQDGPGLEKRVGSAISVISNTVEGTSFPGLGGDCVSTVSARPLCIGGLGLLSTC